MSWPGALEMLSRRNASERGPQDATHRSAALGLIPYAVLCRFRVDFVLLYRGLDLLHEATLGVFGEFWNAGVTQRRGPALGEFD